MKKIILLLVVASISASFSIPVKKIVPQEEKKQNLNLLMIRYQLAR